MISLQTAPPLHEKLLTPYDTALDTARLDCGYGTDAEECDAILICPCHLVTSSSSIETVFRSRLPCIFPLPGFIAVTVVTL